MRRPADDGPSFLAPLIGGGHLVLTIWIGMKDEFNALLPSRSPGHLTELAGMMEVEESFALESSTKVKGSWFDGTTKYWAERLKILDTKIIMSALHFPSANGWLDKQAATTVHA